MASIFDDVARLRDVLRANAVEKSVDEGMLVALLEFYASDEQRVDLVVLDLQGMLGKELSVGAQRQRWEEFKRRDSDSPDSIRIEYEHLVGNAADIETVVHPIPKIVGSSAPSIPSGLANRPVPQVAFSEPPREPCNLKRKSPVRMQEMYDPSPLVTPSTSNARVIAHPIRVISPAQQSKSATGRTSPPSQNAADGQNLLNGKYTFVSPSTSRDSTAEKMDQTTPKNSTAANKEDTAMSFLKKILCFTAINVKFAAFKAVEFSMSEAPGFRLMEFIDEVVDSRAGSLPKADQVWDPPEGGDQEQQRLYQHVYESHLSEQLKFITQALPHVDPEYLEEMIRTWQGDEGKIRNFVSSVLEGQISYPTRAEYNKRKEYNELANKFFTVEEFLELYDDPLKHFSDETRVTDGNYREEALEQLKVDFRFASMAIIRQVFRAHNFHYTPSHNELEKSQTAAHSRKTRRSMFECSRSKAKDLFLIQEIAFVRLQKDIETYINNKKQLRLDAVTEARKRGELIDCPICCEDELIELDMIFCPGGHGVCRNCVRRQTEEQIGVMRNHVNCLAPDCTAEYSLMALKEVLGKSAFVRLEKRRQAEEILAAGIEGLESCPFCDYCQVSRESDKLFECKNPECFRISCRECREPNHLPLRCEEHAMKQRLKNYVEAKMTDALLRECPSCKRKFVKSDGCNKMVCICGTVMCYVCRKQIKDYSHFTNTQPALPGQPAPATNKCPLYSDTNKLHEEEVAKSAKRARAELASSNPNIRVDLVLGKK